MSSDNNLEKMRLIRKVERKSRTNKIKKDIESAYREKQDSRVSDDAKQGYDKIIENNIDNLVKFLGLEGDQRALLREAILERCEQ